MKKTILAVAIAAASYNVSASVASNNIHSLPSDAEKATAFNKMMEANGNDARILVGDGVATVTFTDGQGNKITKDITAADMPEVTERMAKVRVAAERGIRDNMPSVNPPADGDLPPVSDIDPLPQLPSDAEKATAFNKMMEANGNDARILVGDGVATVTFTDGQGNKITKDITAADMPEVTERMAKVRIAAEQVIRDNMPSVSPPADGDLPPVSDIDPLPQLPSDAEKATAFNKMMEANGNDARILVGDGVATVTFTDGQGNKITKDITAADMPEVTERMAKVRVAAEQVIRDNMPSVNPPADGDLPPVSDIDPLPQLPSDAEKATAFNKMMEANGNDARILVGDGVATVTFTDGQGNKITKDITAADMPEVTERMAKVRVAAEQVIRDNMPSVNPPADGDLPPVEDVIVDPIEGDKPAPSEGQKIVEGLKKAADGIRDADKDWGENSTGAIAQYSQSVQAQTQSQIDELYALGNQNATDINTLFNEVDRLDSKIDGVAAMSQASLAARPYLSSNQTSSVGVGIGGAGSEAAFALGYAHRMTENWTANANVAINTGDNAEASYGAGVSYAW
ncbi:YadA C-terminal domain-containing protein [Vibrio splendidus]|uniref:YadA C-terminal domain-containing protein n=1 Tax=Vibrio splendidus TaxID=29497 RepID=UPI000E3252EB|nr:YadA C-terminal domain-containing protein [Vibrio splendidus]